MEDSVVRGLRRGSVAPSRRESEDVAEIVRSLVSTAELPIEAEILGSQALGETVVGVKAHVQKTETIGRLKSAYMALAGSMSDDPIKKDLQRFAGSSVNERQFLDNSTLQHRRSRYGSSAEDKLRYSKGSKGRSRANSTLTNMEKYDSLDDDDGDGRGNGGHQQGNRNAGDAALLLTTRASVKAHQHVTLAAKSPVGLRRRSPARKTSLLETSESESVEGNPSVFPLSKSCHFLNDHRRLRTTAAVKKGAPVHRNYQRSRTQTMSLKELLKSECYATSRFHADRFSDLLCGDHDFGTEGKSESPHRPPRRRRSSGVNSTVSTASSVSGLNTTVANNNMQMRDVCRRAFSPFDTTTSQASTHSSRISGRCRSFGLTSDNDYIIPSLIEGTDSTATLSGQNCNPTAAVYIPLTAVYFFGIAVIIYLLGMVLILNRTVSS